MDIPSKKYTVLSDLPGATMPGVKIKIKDEKTCTKSQILYMMLDF